MSTALRKASSFAQMAIVAMAVVLIAVFAFTAIDAEAVALTAKPSDFGLTEGNTISATGSTDPDIYIVNGHGVKRLFVSPQIFSLYGHLGGFSKVKTVSPTTRDAFVSSGLFRVVDTQPVYCMEVVSEDVAILHWVNTTGAQAVANDPDFFKKTFVINQAEFNLYAVGSTYTSPNQCPVYVRSGVSVSATPVQGNISVSLASSNSASGTFVKSQASADLAHFNFTGTGVVNKLVFERIGVAADTDLTNVYLYDGAKRITDSASVTDGKISFNDTSSTGLFSVNGSKVISVRADLGSNSAITIGVKLISFNGNTVSISGNIHNVASASLATVVLNTSTTPSTNTALDPADNVVIWQNNVTVGTRYVDLHSLQMRIIGSVNVGDLKNFRLFVDGVQNGSAISQTDANGYVVFDLTGAPAKLDTGGRTLKVMADVVGGSNRNFTASLRQAPDIFTIDSQLKQPILATLSSGFPADAGQQTITQGTLTITKTTDSPAGNIVKGASGVSLARFEFKANGESMKVENLRAVFTASNGSVGSLRNGAIFADGVQIGSTQTLNEDNQSPAYTQYSLGSSLVVVPGTPRMIEIRADIFDNDGTDDTTAADTIIGKLAVGSSNVQRLTSLGYVNSAATTANTLTVQTGSLTTGKFSGYANQSVVSPTTNFKVGHFTLTQSSTEDVNVNTISFDGNSVTGTFTIDELTDMYIKVTNDTGNVIYTSPAKATLSNSASNSYSVNFTVPKNKTYQVEAWAKIPSGETATHALTLDMDAVGITTGSSSTTTATASIGQTITVQAGSLTVSNGSLPVASLQAGGTKVDLYQFTLQPAFDDFTLEEIYVDLSSTVASSTGAVSTVELYEGTTMIGSTTVTSTGSISFTGLERLVAQANGTKTFTVKGNLSTVGVGANDTYGTLIARLDGLKYRTSGGSITTTTGLTPASYTGNDNRVVAAYPNFVNGTLDTAPLATGEQLLFKTTVTGEGGNVGLYGLVFAITRTNGPTFNADETTWKLFANGVDISSLATITSAAETNLNAAGANTGYVRFTFTNEYVISTAKTFELRGDVTAIGSNFQGVTVKIANPKSTASAPDDAATKNVAAVTSSTPSITWSDRSTVAHSLTTDDWMNDYLVDGINAGLTRSISQ